MLHSEYVRGFIFTFADGQTLPIGMCSDYHGFPKVEIDIPDDEVLVGFKGKSLTWC